jgi:hypothetical protein
MTQFGKAAGASNFPDARRCLIGIAKGGTRLLQSAQRDRKVGSFTPINAHSSDMRKSLPSHNKQEIEGYSVQACLVNHRDR